MPKKRRRSKAVKKNARPSQTSEVIPPFAGAEIRAEWRDARRGNLFDISKPYGLMVNAAQTFACTKCGARPGAKCVSASGNPLHDPHAARRKIAGR